MLKPWRFHAGALPLTKRAAEMSGKHSARFTSNILEVHMSRSMARQVKGIWSASQILRVGRSRFIGKQDVRDQLRAEGLGATSSRIAERTSISSYRTYDAYKAVSVAFANYVQARGVDRVQDLRPAHAQAFLLAGLEAGLSCNTLRTYAAALGKLDVALSMVPARMHIPPEARLRPGVEAVRHCFNQVAPRLDQERRAYFTPDFVVQAVQGEANRLAARLQLVAGLRVSEVMALNRASLRGEAVDPVLGTPCGLVLVIGKGGFARVQYVPAKEYDELVKYLARHGRMGISYKAYLADLRHACEEQGEKWNGTHALRHNYVRGFVVQASEVGLGSRETMREAMERVGHHRLSELKTYCR